MQMLNVLSYCKDKGEHPMPLQTKQFVHGDVPTWNNKDIPEVIDNEYKSIPRLRAAVCEFGVHSSKLLTGSCLHVIY